MNENVMLTKFTPVDKNLPVDKKQPTKASNQADKSKKDFNDFFKKANIETGDNSEKPLKAETDLLATVAVPIPIAILLDMSKNVAISTVAEGLPLDVVEGYLETLVSSAVDESGLATDNLFSKELMAWGAKNADIQQSVSGGAADNLSPVKADNLSPVKADNLSPVKADNLSPVKADILSPVKADILSPVKADILSPVKADNLSPVKADILSPVKAVADLNAVFIPEKNVESTQADLLNLLKGKSDLNVAKLSKMPEESVVVSQSDLTSVQTNKGNKLNSLVTNIVDSSDIVDDMAMTVPVKQEDGVITIKNQRSNEAELLKNQEVDSVVVEKASDSLLNQSQGQMQNKGEGKGEFLTKEVVVFKQETVAGQAVQPFTIPVTEMSRSVQASPQTPETPAMLERYNIQDQIVEQARLIKTTENTQMVIKLKPEHLGELTVKVSVENGVVSASFHSDNVNVRAALETSLLQLKQEFAAQGIKVDNVSVYSGLGQFLSDGQNQANREQQNAKSKNRKIDLADFEEESDKLESATSDRGKSEGVDYRI